MNQAEARHILNLCKTHNLPKPQRRSLGNGQYALQWATQRFTVTVDTFDGALHQCRCFFEEIRHSRRSI